MNYDQIILELLNRIQNLEVEVSVLKEQSLSSNISKKQEITFSNCKGSKKYQKFSDFLSKSDKDKITLSFDQIRAILGFLPESSSYRACWANTDTHSISRSWLSVGYRAIDVDMDKKIITFIKINKGESNDKLDNS